MPKTDPSSREYLGFQVFITLFCLRELCNLGIHERLDNKARDIRVRVSAMILWDISATPKHQQSPASQFSTWGFSGEKFRMKREVSAGPQQPQTQPVI